MTTPFPPMTPFPPPSPTPASIAVPVIKTTAQLHALLDNIARLQHERTELHRAQETEIAAVRQRYRAPLAELDHYLDLETSWAEAWARQNPAAFASVDCVRYFDYANVTFGFRADPPKIERASRRWTWTRIAATLAGLAWGRRYLRIPAAEVDKEAIVADLATLSPIDLRNAGLIVTQGEHFFITTQENAEISAPNLQPTWQEAA